MKQIFFFFSILLCFLSLPVIGQEAQKEKTFEIVNNPENIDTEFMETIAFDQWNMYRQVDYRTPVKVLYDGKYVEIKLFSAKELEKLGFDVNIQLIEKHNWGRKDYADELKDFQFTVEIKDDEIIDQTTW